MGPNCIKILDEMLTKYPLNFDKQQKTLDLGCGKGLTSLFIANETDATVYVNDLWVSAEKNSEQFRS